MTTIQGRGLDINIIDLAGAKRRCWNWNQREISRGKVRNKRKKEARAVW